MTINSTNSKIRILVTEDDHENRSMLAALIRRFGYDCDEAEDGHRACDLLCEREYDLVVADIHMPGNCSLELLDAANEVAPRTPFVLVTASPSQETAINAIGTQVHAYLEKPVPAERLRKSIEEALKSRHTMILNQSDLLHEVAKVLNETKQNFKSRRLATLRHKVEGALEGKRPTQLCVSEKTDFVH